MIECQDISYGVGRLPSKTGRVKTLTCVLPIIEDPQEFEL